jgi:Bacterial Ig-like domain (group 3)/Chitobiase/beta-hexosaminidase C-terminal domain/Legume lectin domain
MSGHYSDRSNGKTRTILLALSLLLLLLPVADLWAQTPTPVLVPTWRYDLTHAGQNTNETALTPANVNVNSFGKLFTLKVDSTTYSQPLYVPGLTINGAVHNVLFVATSNDSVYAFDADSNGGSNAAPLWQVSMLSASHGAGPGATAIPWQDTGSPDIANTIGITGTPTLNPATNTLYLVAASKESGVYFSRLHALNILTGAEQPNSPVVVTATVAGTGNGSTGGQLTFSPLWENQRTALNYYNGYVYFGYAAHGDFGPWHGWLFSYNGTTLAQNAVLCLSPNGFGNGIWESGAGMPIDNDAAGGRMFAAIGNGTFTTYPPFNANTEYGEGVIALNLANGGLTPTDAFTAFNAEILNGSDRDQGSGGVLMVPDQQGTFPHELVTAGKEGRILVLNRDQLGGFAGEGAGSNTQIPQDIPGQIKGLWSTPAYWNGNVYTWGNGDVPKLFQMSNGVLSTAPVSQSTITSADPGASFSVSSNGAQNGIAWAVRTDKFNSNGPGVLYAWEANDLTKTIYESDTNAARDAGSAANRYSIPIVTNGKVYVAENGAVDVYGLFNDEPTAAAPAISPNGGTFPTPQSVTLSSTTASATIYYTLDGTVPTPASTVYTEPITISADTTVRAIASAVGFVQSAVSSAVFTFTGQAPAVTFLPAAGTYTAAQQVTLSDTDTAAKLYYTTDGTAPTAASNLYTGPIAVAASETINAIAIDPALQNSNISTAAYVIQPAATMINFGEGFSSTTGLQLNGSTLATNDTRMQLTNGGLNEAGSVFWTTPINIQSFSTTFEFQLSLAQGNGFTFTIQNNAATALGGDSAGLGYAGIGKSVAVKFDFYNYAGEGDDSTGVFTDGALPTVPAVDISPSGIELNSGDAIIATVTYDGTTLTLNLLDLVTNKSFTYSDPINIPQVVGGNTAYVGFTGGTGGLSASQKLLTWTYVTPLSAAAPATTTTSLSASTTQITAGQAVTFNVGVSAGASATPTGTVNLLDGTTSLGMATLTNGTATFNITSLPVGTQSITASYVGNSTDAASVSAAVLVQVAAASPATTTTTLSASATQVTAGQTVTFNAAVAANAGSTPTGTVTLLDGTTSLGTATLANGAASFNVTTLAAGTHSITASYAGSNTDAASTSTALSIQVNVPATTTTTLAASPTTAQAGQAIALTATVAPASGSTVPTGKVTFNDGSTAIGTSTLVAGNGSFSISTLAVGTHTITAVYSGDAGDTGSTSSAVTVTISSAPAADYTMTLSGSTVVATQAAPGTLTVTVTPQNGFNASLGFACTGLPSGWGCTFAPATISGGTAQSTTLTVGPTTNSSLTPRSPGLVLAFASPLAFFFLRLGGGKLWKTRLVIVAALTLFMVGCGGVANSNGGSQSTNYTVTLTASGASAPTHAQTFVATINP